MDDALVNARQELTSALGRQSDFWGVGKRTGEQYAALYLSDRPLSLGELAEALDVTKGSVSGSIRFLEQLGMVRRLTRPGDRRIFFEAETDFWVVARRVLERRQKPEFDDSFEMVRQGLESARKAPPGPERDFVVKRFEELLDFYAELDQLVELVLALGPERLARIVRVGARVLGRGPDLKGRDR